MYKYSKSIKIIFALFRYNFFEYNKDLETNISLVEILQTNGIIKVWNTSNKLANELINKYTNKNVTFRVKSGSVN